MVGMMLKSLACLTLLCAVGGDVIAYQAAEADATKPEANAAAPTAKENFVLRLTAVRERATDGPSRDMQPYFPSGRGTKRSQPAPEVSNPFSTSTETPQETVQVTEHMELFCEDVQVSAKVNEAGSVAYTLTCKGHVRIKGKNSMIVGRDAALADGVIKLLSAEVSTGDAVIKTSEASFEFPLTALQISRVGDQPASETLTPADSYLSSEPAFNPPTPVFPQ